MTSPDLNFVIVPFFFSLPTNRGIYCFVHTYQALLLPRIPRLLPISASARSYNSRTYLPWLVGLVYTGWDLIFPRIPPPGAPARSPPLHSSGLPTPLSTIQHYITFYITLIRPHTTYQHVFFFFTHHIPLPLPYHTMLLLSGACRCSSEGPCSPS